MSVQKKSHPIITFPVDNTPQKGQPAPKVIKIVKEKVEKDENDIPKIKHVKPEIVARIKTQRQQLCWTRDELAKKACVNVHIVAEYENGTAVVNGDLQQKILVTLEKGMKERVKNPLVMDK